MAGILQVFVPLRYGACIVNNVGGNRTIIKETLRRLQTISRRPILDFSRKRRAYFSSDLKLAIDTKMTDKNEVFQPLPINVVPHHYDLTLRLDLDNFKFEGKQNIHINVNETTDTVVMNAVDLEVQNVSFHGEDGEKLDAEECNTIDNNLLTIKFPKQLLSGKTGNINMQFQGIINDSMRGLYRCKSMSPKGETKYAAVTQFESIDARRCFPCWDEPAHKATFDITLIVPTGLTALSNMPVKHETVQNNVSTIKFDTTPKMSTYLVALVVGEFDYVEDKIENGVVIRVYTPKGKSKQGELALEVATKSLSYYNKYFGLSYPLPKLDCVAVADFAAGAMENWGLVTYRESCVLFDEENTSTATKQWIGLVIAHELAHQWFGNLVTMNWWTDLWLNEGYATFTEYVCLGDLYPEFNTWKQFVTDVLCRALDLDALKNSHPIEVPINNPDEIDEIFDDISYNKAASVIRMLYLWLGKEDFMKGMNSYLKDNAYANADTAILWRSLEKASNKPVSQIMPTWTKQTGYPILSVEQKQEGNNRVLTISQQRFLADGTQDESNTLWIVPVNVTTSVDPNAIAMSMLLKDKQAEFVIPNVPEGSWVNINPGKVGFYRAKYSRDMMYALLPAIENKTLPALDRYGFLDDLFNSAKAGYTSTVDVLNVLEAYKQEDDYIVWNSIVTCLSRIRSLISHLPFYEDYKAFCRNIFKSISKKVGWEAKRGESHLDTLLRTLVINRMVMLQDEETVAEAKRRFDLHVSGTSLIPADLRSCVYRAVINNGNESTLQTMLELYEKVELHEEKDRILSSLGVVRDTALLQKVLEHSLSDSVRTQDIIYVFQSTAWSAESRDFTWKFIKDNWTAYNTKIQTINLLSRLVKWTTEDFVSEDMARDVENFFSVHPNSGIDRPAKQSIEKIRMNTEWLRRDKDAIEQFLLKSK